MVVERCTVPLSPPLYPPSPPLSLQEVDMSFESGCAAILPELRSRTRSRHRSQPPPRGSRGEQHSQNSCLVDGLERGLGILETLAARNNIQA